MNQVTPEDGMKITRDTKLVPGVYFLPHGIEIAADGVTLDGNGALIVGDDSESEASRARQRTRGVTINRRTGVTVKHLRVERYYHGIWANACANLHLQRNQITRTHELAGPDVFLDVWLDQSQAYGGAIFCNGVRDSFITDNDVQHQQNGVMLYRCENVEVTRNEASFNSGAGILMYESSLNKIEHNTADFCSRIYHYADHARTGHYHNGADAAGLVMMCASSRNTIRHNMLRGGGDGVFLGGFHKDQIKVPCNDNVFEHNDGSFSPNIAFEATFSQRNVFRHNRADACNYGFWLGYSSETTLEQNTIRQNRIAGIAIEHGHHNAITDNVFEQNAVGCQFWSSAQAAFGAYFPDCGESHETSLRKNQFTRNEIGVHIWSEKSAAHLPPQRCANFVIAGNTLRDNRIALRLERVRASSLTQNHITDNVEAGVVLQGCADVVVTANELARNGETVSNIERLTISS
jgi:parallel beta-helix repeat protein